MNQLKKETAAPSMSIAAILYVRVLILAMVAMVALAVYETDKACRSLDERAAADRSLAPRQCPLPAQVQVWTIQPSDPRPIRLERPFRLLSETRALPERF